MNLKVLSVFGAIVVVILGAALYFALHTTPVQPPFSGASGGDFFNPVTINAGYTVRGSISTTSQGSPTITATEFRNWANVGLVTYSPGLLAGGTLTLPASSTLTSFLPQAGDTARVCIQNGTSTIAVNFTLAGALGFKLQVASSSATALGGVTIPTGKFGCMDIFREIATSSPWGNLDALLTVYQ